MNEFDKAEYTNRPAAVKVLKKLCECHPTFKGWELKEAVVEEKTNYDFWLEKDGRKILIEHKARNYRKDSFPDWQLSGRKVELLVDRYKEDPEIVGLFYINTFLDGCAIWNLKRAIKGEFGRRDWSKPHYAKTVVDSPLCVTYDWFLKLEDAAYVE